MRRIVSLLLLITLFSAVTVPAYAAIQKVDETQQVQASPSVQDEMGDLYYNMAEFIYELMFWGKMMWAGMFPMQDPPLPGADPADPGDVP